MVTLISKNIKRKGMLHHTHLNMAGNVRLHNDPKYSNKIYTRVAASLMSNSHSFHLEYYGNCTIKGSITSSLNKLLS